MVLNPFKCVGRRAYTRAGTGAGARDRSCGRRDHQRRLRRELVADMSVGVPGSGGEHSTPAAQRRAMDGRRATGDNDGEGQEGEGTVGDSVIYLRR